MGYAQKVPITVDLGTIEYDQGDIYNELSVVATNITYVPGEKGTRWDPPSYPEVEYVLEATDENGQPFPVTPELEDVVETQLRSGVYGKSVHETIIDAVHEYFNDSIDYEDRRSDSYSSNLVNNYSRRRGMIEQEYYVPLYRILTSKALPETQRLAKAADWLASNALKVTNQVVRHTFKKAGRQDLVDIFAARENVQLGDTVRSKNTGRFGMVVGIHWDDETVDVKWETGGVQPISKGALQKMHEKKLERFDNKDFAQVESEFDNYGTMTDKKKSFRKSE